MTEVVLNNLERLTKDLLVISDNFHGDGGNDTKKVLQDDESNQREFLNVILSNSLEYDIFDVRRSMVSQSNRGGAQINSRDKLKLKELDSRLSEFKFESIFRIKDEQATRAKELRKQKMEKERKEVLTEKSEEPSSLLSENEKQRIEKTKQSSESNGYLNISEQKDNDLTMLRNRLLSKNSRDLKLNSNSTTDEKNKVHENRQESLLSDMLGLVGQLKSNVATFNDSLNEDTELLGTANEKLEKVGSNVTVIMEGLKKYTTEYGNKYGFWFYVYVTIALVVVPLIMLLIIRLIPRF